MAFFDTSGAEFNGELRKFETTEKVHADVFNERMAQLIRNDTVLMLGQGKNSQVEFLLNARKTGKRYGVHFDDFGTSPAPEGTRLYDAIGMTCEPSTNSERGVNDFENESVFFHIEANGYVDADGEFQVQYIKGVDNDFSRTERDTWCLYPTQYVLRRIDANGEDVVISDTRHSQDWLPEGAAIRTDGTIRPFVAIAKYMSGDNSEGVAASISGAATKNYSFQSFLTKARAKGMQYCGETSQDSEHMARLMEIAFATRHSQSVMTGCASYYYQYPATITEDGVERIIISKSNANNLVVGSTVSIGNATTLNTGRDAGNIDRGQAGMHAKANRVKILKIESYDDSNSAVYVDNGGTKFSTASTVVSGLTCPTYLSTMPWNTGACDDVLGSCGSPNSYTNNKEPYILFGVEMSSGFWEPKGNTVMKIENHVMRPYICYDCTLMTTAGATTEDWEALGYEIPNCAAAWKYISKLGYDADNPEVRYPVEVDATSSTGYADGCYTENLEAAADGQREVLGAGALDFGAGGGRRVARLNRGLSYSAWACAARLSASGRCGRKATA